MSDRAIFPETFRLIMPLPLFLLAPHDVFSDIYPKRKALESMGMILHRNESQDCYCFVADVAVLRRVHENRKNIRLRISLEFQPLIIFGVGWRHLTNHLLLPCQSIGSFAFILKVEPSCLVQKLNIAASRTMPTAATKTSSAKRGGGKKKNLALPRIRVGVDNSPATTD